METTSDIAAIVNNIETASTFNKTGDWTMKLNKLKMDEVDRRNFFYKINFPFNTKAEFFDRLIYFRNIQ